MPVLKSLALATVLILELMTSVDAAPISQLGYSRPVPKQGGGGYSSHPRTRELEVLADKYRPGY
ncbi:hypothetical protein [Bradyrhizobium sp.]|uniref:hypothetical protein n=1 Tax=Bradyrhizobium sp. TaxID=376 RepID=UPI003C70CF49